MVVIVKYTLALITILTLLVSGCSVLTTAEEAKNVANEVVLTDLTEETPEEVVETPTVSDAELATHSIKTDCWIGYEGKVYDITSFLPRQPGKCRSNRTVLW
jgi:cytochrome b involved in lipid metabolism